MPAVWQLSSEQINRNLIAASLPNVSKKSGWVIRRSTSRENCKQQWEGRPCSSALMQARAVQMHPLPTLAVLGCDVVKSLGLGTKQLSRFALDHSPAPELAATVDDPEGRGDTRTAGLHQEVWGQSS